MYLDNLQRNWNAFGKKDPLWAILTDPDRRRRKWDLEAFFKTGQTEINDVLQYAGVLDLPRARHRALDFGCGVGRLTQAMCAHFDACDGVDIAPSMIQQARDLNSYGDRCRYHVNASGDLSLFETNSFDFIYSRIVLQHIRPEYSKEYVREFVRVLHPGGLLAFQVPSELKPEALPLSAFNAQISLSGDVERLVAGSKSTLQVTVRNASTETWPAWNENKSPYGIRLGNHWLDSKDSMLANDDGRVGLPADMHPGDEAQLQLTIEVPPEEGEYILELDMVQELVGWFKTLGSNTSRTRVTVGTIEKEPTFRDKGGRSPLNPLKRILARGRRTLATLGWGSRGFEPHMEMHIVPREEIQHLIQESGGRLVEVKPDISAGPIWDSYFYWVTKAR